MGSTDRAVITGFICRLCSHMSRYVIHVYSDTGISMGLADKINSYLPVTITATDPLPKTVCITCIEGLYAHHNLIQKISWTRRAILTQLRAQTYPNHTSSSSGGGGGGASNTNMASSSESSSVHNSIPLSHSSVENIPTASSSSLQSSTDI